MARWRLTEAHYLYTNPDTIWERVETDTETGRQVRKQYVVPAYFHHEIECDWTDKGKKAVIVCNGHNPKRRDIIFIGDPTPGMLPLDEEAEAITAKLKHKWNIPDTIKWGPGQYSSALADHFAEQQDRVNMKMSALTEQNTQAINQFMQQMGLQQSQMMKILEILADKSTPLSSLSLGEQDGPVESDNQRPATAVAAGRRRF